MTKLGMLFLVGVALSGGVADAGTYYVSKSGNNGYSCAQAQSMSTPKQTITAGLGCIAAGDTLLIRAGTYDEVIFNNVPSGTSWSNKVRIAAYPGETVWMTPLSNGAGNGRVIFFGGGAGISPQYIEFDGINIDDTHLASIAVYFDSYGGANPNHIRMQNAEVREGATGGAGAILIGSNDNEFINLTVHGGGEDGDFTCGPTCASYAFYIAGSNNLIEHCDMYDTSGAGVHIYSGSQTPSNNIVRNNRIHDITRAGSMSQVWGVLISGNNNQVFNNLIYNIATPVNTATNAGISVYSGSNNKILNNTIYNNTNSGIYINAVNGTEVKNNIVYASTGASFVNGGSGTIESNNLFGANPQFVNAGAMNFQLQSASPARDAGTTLSMVTTDFSGVARPQGSAPDIGAFEYSLQDAPPAAPTGLRVVAH